MKYEIKNRWTGSVQFTAEIECAEDAPMSVKIGLSGLWGYKNGADLYGAYLDGADLVGDRPFLQIGPIGSRQDQLRAWIRETGTYVQTGCFKGSLDDFCAAVQKSHGADDRGLEYLAAIDLIQVHAEIWGADE